MLAYINQVKRDIIVKSRVQKYYEYYLEIKKKRRYGDLNLRLIKGG